MTRVYPGPNSAPIVRLLVLAALLISISSDALASGSSFTRYTSCEGYSVSRPDNKKTKVQFLANYTFKQEEHNVLNSHKVTVQKFGQTEISLHPHFYRECREQENIVYCSGHGLGTGNYEFNLQIDLKTMKATGLYKETYHPEKTIATILEFTEANPLSCVF